MLNHKIQCNSRQQPYKTCYQSLLRSLMLALFMLPLSVTAGIYKWVDDQGNVHYGSQRPENTQAEKLKIETTKKLPYQPADAAKDEAAKKAEAGKAKAEKQAPAAEPAKAEPAKPPPLSRKEKKRLCSQARERLSMIESHGRLKATDDKGNVRHLTDTERAGRLKSARADVARYCR